MYLISSRELIHITYSAATVDFWQTRTPQWRTDQQYAISAGAVFYTTKSRQNRSLAGLTSLGGPDLHTMACFEY